MAADDFRGLIAWHFGSRLQAMLLLALLVAAASCMFIAAEALLDVSAQPLSMRVAGTATDLTVDGADHRLTLSAPVQAMTFAPAEPYRREYQIDGTDSTNNSDLVPSYFAGIAKSRYYGLQSFLRDEGSYSQWRNLRVTDGQGVPIADEARPADGEAFSLPSTFEFSVAIRRLEAPRRLDFQEVGGGTASVVLNRNDKYVRVSEARTGGGETAIAKYYFPHSWLPEAGTYLYSWVRAVGLGLGAVVLLVCLGGLISYVPVPKMPEVSRWHVVCLTVCVFGCCLFSSLVLSDRLPWILDARSYYFQGKILAAGRLWVTPPSAPNAFQIPFTVVRGSKWFSQYPIGTPLLLALGFLLQAPWMVEPALATMAAVLVFLVGRRQFGATTAILATALFAISPFVYLQAGSFLSHVPAMFFGLAFVYCATRYTEAHATRWALLGAAALGMALLIREQVAAIYGISAGAFTVIRMLRRGPRRLLGDGLKCGVVVLPILAVYFAYNWSLTGSFLETPRNLWNPGLNHYGFGTGFGFYGEHTLGGGIVNADEQLASLNIILFGWPFYASLAFLPLPFLLGKARAWDWMHASIVLTFIAIYLGYYYHGIALGPRYYFEAVPSLVLLTSRGVMSSAALASWFLTRLRRHRGELGSQYAAAGMLGALTACSVFYFGPRQIELRENVIESSKGSQDLEDFIKLESERHGPDWSGALLVTTDGYVYGRYLAARNCPTLDCKFVFALSGSAEAESQLKGAYGSRSWFIAQMSGGHLTFVPQTLAAPPSIPSPTPITWSVSDSETILHLPLESSPTGTRNEQPVEGEVQLVPTTERDAVMLHGLDYLVYDHVPVMANKGSIGFWIEPLWDGNDNEPHMFVEAGSGPDRVVLSKDGNNALRFQIWDGASRVESNVAQGIRDWKAGQWHHIVASWDEAGVMTLFVDGSKVGSGTVIQPTTDVSGLVRVGIDGGRSLRCDCLMSDLRITDSAEHGDHLN